mmetsp:Transcript_91676/g.182167  ORF Transcript_91676/g.182167 Transcript_91676/m.182167 type:complete len:161 (-) Transcript_91676:314-796(-)
MVLLILVHGLVCRHQLRAVWQQLPTAWASLQLHKGLCSLRAGRIQYSLWVVQPGLGQRQYILQVGGRRDMVAVQMRVLCIAKQLAKHTSIKNVIDPAATNVKASSSAVVPHCIRQVILSNGELTDETNRGRITQPLLSKGTLPKSKRKTAPTTSQSPLPI